MGLDKKLSPPKRKIKYHEEKDVCSCRHALHSDPSISTVEEKSRKNSLSFTLPGHEASVGTVEETLETEEEYSKEEMENQSGQESDDSEEDSSKHEYDEDFEADEEANEEGQTGDQTNGMSESSSDEKNRNLDYGKESDTSSQKALQASGSEKDESDGYSDRDSEDDPQKRRPADSLLSISTQCSTEGDSQAEMMTHNVNGEEECDIKSASDSAAHAHCGNENGEKKLLRTEENQETSALEKKRIDEAEKTKAELTAREDTGIFHENIMAMQHPNLEVNGEFKHTVSGERNMNEEEECLPVPWESRVWSMEDGNEEAHHSEEGAVFEDYKPVQEEIAKATGNDHPVNSDPEPGDSCASEEGENTASPECDASGASDGRFSAEGRRSLGVQEAAGQAVQEGKVTGQRAALEQDAAAEGEDAGSGEARGKAARGAGDSLPQADTGAALEESAPEEGSVAEEHPRGKGTGEAVRLGTDVSPAEQEGMETEVALGKAAPGREEVLPGWEAGRAVSQGQEGAGDIAEEEQEEEAAEEGLEGVAGLLAEEVGEAVSEAEESLGEGGSAGVGAVPGEEAVEDADGAADGIAGVIGPEGEKGAEEDTSEGEEAVGKPGALWEALGNMETGEAMPGGEGFVKPDKFSQLKVSGEEQMETGKALSGAAALENRRAWDVGRNAFRRVDDTMEAPAESGKGPVLEGTPRVGTPGDARGDPGTEGPSQLQEVPAAQEQEAAAEALWSGDSSAGSTAGTEGAAEGESDGELVGGCAGAAGEGSGGAGEATDAAAGSGEPPAGTEGRLRGDKGRGNGRCPGEGAVGEAALPSPGLCVARAGEPGLVAIAVLGGQAERGALPGEPALPGGSAGAGGAAVGTGAVAQEGVTGAGLSRTEGVSAKARGAVGESGRDGEGVAHGPVAGGREVNQEAAGACEGRGAMPAGAEGQGGGEQERGAVPLVSPGHGEVLGAVSLREQPSAESSPSIPARGAGGVEPMGTGSAGGEGLCRDTQPQPAATATARGRDRRQEEDMEQAGAKAEGEQPSPGENTSGSKAEDVSVSAGSAAGAGEQSTDSARGSPGVPGAGGQSTDSARRSPGDPGAGEQSTDSARGSPGDPGAGGQSTDSARGSPGDPGAGGQSTDSARRSPGDPGAGGQSTDSARGSPGDPGAAGVGDRSRSPHQDGANPGLVIVSSEQPQDGEETPL